MNQSRRKLSLLLFCMIFFCVSMQAHAQSAGKVTGYEKITWGISTGRYYVNGTHAFCAQYNKSWPLVGTEVTRIESCTNEVLRKALYYGYNGPANTLGTDERAHVLTAIAVSDANIGEQETGAASKYDTFYWDIVNNPTKYPAPPKNFKAYMAITSSDDLQNLAFYEVEKMGYVKAIKSSSNPTITNGNECYSLEGAQYGLYSNASLSGNSKVGTLIMDARGYSNTVELPAGTYYAYEILAPKGYQKSETVTTFVVTSEQTTTLQFQDDPQVVPVDILLQKVDKETGDNKPQGLATLEGAEFKVCFYKGYPEKPQGTPDKEWTFRTDAEGKVRHDAGALPFGTLVIREIKPSAGYLLNEDVFVRRLTTEKPYELVIVEEEFDKPKPYDLVISKTDTYGNRLSKAEFTLYAEPSCETKVMLGVTDIDGLLRLSGLEVDTKYYLKETKAPAGYVATIDEDGESKIYEISAIYNPIAEEFIGYIDGEAIINNKTTDKQEVCLSVINDLGYQLPKTGSCTKPIMTWGGVVLCSISIYVTNKEKRRKRL